MTWTPDRGSQKTKRNKAREAIKDVFVDEHTDPEVVYQSLLYLRDKVDSYIASIKRHLPEDHEARADEG